MKNNHIAIFAWEAYQCQPNRDPYSGDLRIFEETNQAYTSEEHLKHHWRRGLKTIAKQKYPNDYEDDDAIVFYEKKTKTGNSITLVDKDKKFKNIPTSKAVDLPLFGVVKTVKNKNEQLTGAVHTLFLPATYHKVSTLTFGVNNAFPQIKEEKKDTKKDKNGKNTTNQTQEDDDTETQTPETSNTEPKTNESSGSHTTTLLTYGLYIAIIEINPNQLQINLANKNHTIGENTDKWIELAMEGLWEAYTNSRYTSASQNNQFALFQTSWEANFNTHYPKNPIEIYETDNIPTAENTQEGQKLLSEKLEKYLKDMGFNKNTAKHTKVAPHITKDIKNILIP